MVAKQECSTGRLSVGVVLLGGVVAAVVTALLQLWLSGEASPAVAGAVAAAVAAGLYSQRGKADCETDAAE